MFKKGDTVVCIDTTDTDEQLTAGRPYTVRSARGPWVFLQGVEAIWRADRFRPYTDEDDRQLGMRLEAARGALWRDPEFRALAGRYLGRFTPSTQQPNVGTVRCKH